jgi:hypothetical protein
MRLSIGSEAQLQMAQRGAKRGAKRGSGITTHPRTKEPWWKRSHGMLLRSNVLTTKSWVNSQKIMKK